ncbi:hypothetical protein ACF1BQ_034625 [Bradyrhizobium sp. RDT10]
MTEYNFRHQTKMMSIGLAGLRMAKHPARIHLQFYSLFRGLHAQPAGFGAGSARLTGYFSHETFLGRVAHGGVR